MDYYRIGQRIRKYRKAYGLSQEQLAEKVGISVTHMSHIETGNTKLGLPVLVALAEVLQVQCDDLVRDGCFDRFHTESEILELLDGCYEQQRKILLDVLRATKISLDKHMMP